MKKLVFKYFDESCYGELIPHTEDPDYKKPVGKGKSFGYTTNTQYLFYNGYLQYNVDSMFGVGRTEFRNYFIEWFEDRYNLPVSCIV